MRDFQSFSRITHANRIANLINENTPSEEQRRAFCIEQLAQRAALIVQSDNLPIEQIQNFKDLISIVPISAITGYLLSKTKIQTRHVIHAHYEISPVRPVTDYTYQLSCPCSWKHSHAEANTLHVLGDMTATLQVEDHQITYNCQKCKYHFRMNRLNMTLRGIAAQHPYFFHTQNFDHVMTRQQQLTMIADLFKCWNAHRRIFDFEKATKIIEAPFVAQKRNGTTSISKAVFLEYHTLMSLMTETFQDACNITERKGYGVITRLGGKSIFDPFGFAPITQPHQRYPNTVFVAQITDATKTSLQGYGYLPMSWKCAPNKLKRNLFHLLPLDSQGQLDRPMLDTMYRQLDAPFLMFRPYDAENDTVLLHGLTPRGEMVPLKPEDCPIYKPIHQFLPITMTLEQVLAFYEFARNPLSNIEYLYPADTEIKPFLNTIGDFHTDTANMLAGFPTTVQLKNHDIVEHIVHSLSTPRIPILEALHDELDSLILNHRDYLVEHAYQFEDQQVPDIQTIKQAAIHWSKTNPGRSVLFNHDQNRLLYLIKKRIFQQEATNRGFSHWRLEDYPKKVVVDTSPTGSGKSYYSAKIAKAWQDRHTNGRTFLITKSPFSATPTVKSHFTFLVGRSREDRIYNVQPGSRRITPISSDETVISMNAKCERLDEINTYAVEMEYDAAVKKVCNQSHCPLFQSCQARTLVQLSHEYAADRTHDIAMSETTFSFNSQFCTKQDLVIFDDIDIVHTEMVLQGKTKYLIEKVIDTALPLWNRVNSIEHRHLISALRTALQDSICGRVSKRVANRLTRFLEALQSEWALTRGLNALTLQYSPCLHVPSITNALYLCATTNYDDIRAYFRDFETIENVTRHSEKIRPHTVLVEHDKFVGNWSTNTNMIHYMVEDIHRVLRRHDPKTKWGLVTHKFNIDYLQGKLSLVDLVPRFSFFTLFKKTPHFHRYRDYFPVHVKETLAFKEFEKQWRNIMLAYIDDGSYPNPVTSADIQCWHDIQNWVDGYRAFAELKERFICIPMGNVKSNNAFHEQEIQHVIQLGDARVSKDTIKMRQIEPVGDAFIENGTTYQHFPLNSPEAMCNARLSQQVTGRVRANRYNDACFHYLVGVTVPYVLVDETMAGFPAHEDAPVTRYAAKIQYHIGNFWYDRALGKRCPRDRLIAKQTTEYIDRQLQVILNKAEDHYVQMCWRKISTVDPFLGTDSQWDRLKSFIIEDVAKRINMSILDVCRALLELGLPYSELQSLRVYKWYLPTKDKASIEAHYQLIMQNSARDRLLGIHHRLYERIKERWRRRPPPEIIKVA